VANIDYQSAGVFTRVAAEKKTVKIRRQRLVSNAGPRMILNIRVISWPRPAVL
jgi:hypothetical protein